MVMTKTLDCADYFCKLAYCFLSFTVSIFIQFMYGLIVPDYRNSPRPEEDIPKILKMLGYPFMISKSAMFAVGSPHMWPSILAALNWLVELIEVIIPLL